MDQRGRGGRALGGESHRVGLCGSSSPCGAQDLVLVERTRLDAAGTNSSHTPHSTRLRIGWRRPSQPLNSPITLTRWALGAQTAKAVPATPSIVARVRAQLLVEAEMGALGQEIDVDLAQHRREAVGVLDQPLLARRASRHEAVGEALAVARDRALEEARGMGHARARPPGLAAHAPARRAPRAGRRARPGARSPPPCMPSSANGSPWRPSSRAATAAGSARDDAASRVSVVSACCCPPVSPGCRRSWPNRSRMPRQRDAQPARPVRRLVADLVEELLDHEEAQQRVGRHPDRRASSGSRRSCPGTRP